MPPDWIKSSLVDVPQNELPADVTFGGKFHVDFAASVALLMP